MTFNPNNFRKEDDPILNLKTSSGLSVKNELQNTRDEHAVDLKEMRRGRDAKRKEGKNEEADELQHGVKIKKIILSQRKRPEQNAETLSDAAGLVLKYFENLNSSMYSNDPAQFKTLLEKIPKNDIKTLLSSDYEYGNFSSRVLLAMQRTVESLNQRGMRMYHDKQKYKSFITEVLIEGTQDDGKIYENDRVLDLLENLPSDIKPEDKEKIRIQVDKNIDKYKISELFFKGIQGKKSIEGLISIGSKATIELIYRAIEETMNSGREDVNRNILDSLNYDYQEYYETTKLVTKIVGKNLEDKFGIRNGDKVVKRWQNNVSMGIWGNLRVMRNIEAEQPGGIKILNESYGICEFNRYPKEMLVDQIKYHGQDVPYGVVLFPAEDYNDAFDQDKAVLQQLYDGTKWKHISRVFEIEGRLSLARFLVDLKLKYKHKIDFMILAGHGEKSGMEFSWKSRLDKDVVDKSTSIESIKAMMIDEPSIALFSCSTGAEQGLAQLLSERLNARVQAPTVSSGPESLSVRYEGDKPILDVKFRDDQKEYIRGI